MKPVKLLSLALISLFALYWIARGADYYYWCRQYAKQFDASFGDPNGLFSSLKCTIPDKNGLTSEYADVVCEFVADAKLMENFRNKFGLFGEIIDSRAGAVIYRPADRSGSVQLTENLYLKTLNYHQETGKGRAFLFTTAASLG